MSDQENKILNTASSWKVPESRSQEELWASLESRIHEQEEKYNSSFWRYRWIAASVLLLISVAVFYWLPSNVMIKTGTVEIRQITLPDGTSVTLNAASALSYDPSTYDDLRALNFEGEGFFDVKPGAQFSVKLNGTVVEVLGTSFNIYARDEIAEVKCLTGKVEVASRDQSVILFPGRSVRSNSTQLESARDFVASEAISWQQGKFLFENTPLSRVITELEIQYGVKVTMKSREERFYTGYFDNKNLEKAAKQVFSPLGYSYEIVNKEIIVK